jgi:hypothetical protein
MWDWSLFSSLCQYAYMLEAGRTGSEDSLGTHRIRTFVRLSGSVCFRCGSWEMTLVQVVKGTIVQEMVNALETEVKHRKRTTSTGLPLLLRVTPAALPIRCSATIQYWHAGPRKVSDACYVPFENNVFWRAVTSLHVESPRHLAIG